MDSFSQEIWIELFKLLPLLFLYNGYFQRNSLFFLSESYLADILEKSRFLLVLSEEIGNIHLTGQVAQFWIKLAQKVYRVCCLSDSEEEEQENHNIE